MKSRILLLVVLLLLFVIGLFVVSGLTAGQTEATPTLPQEQTPLAARTPNNEAGAPAEALPISARVLQHYAYTEIQSQVVNGVDMSVANFRYVEDEYFKGKILVDICHLVPDEKEWLIHEGTITAGNQKFLMHRFVVLEDATGKIHNGMRTIARRQANGGFQFGEAPADQIPAYYCYNVEFVPYPTLAEEDVDLSRLTLVVQSLRFSPPMNEEEQCAFYLTELQEALNRDNIGIELGCSEPDEWGNITPVLLKKPEGMSNDEAMKLVGAYRDRLWMIGGPWVFTGSIMLSEANP